MNEEHLPGAVVTYRAYTNTSKTPNGYMGELARPNIIIRERNCANVSLLTNDEQEVLCPRGMAFRVIKRIPMGEKYPEEYFYELEEVTTAE